jgi:hypothetical protein
VGNANKLNAIEFVVLCVCFAFVGEGKKKQETLHFSFHSCMEYNVLFVGCSVSEVCFDTLHCIQTLSIWNICYKFSIFKHRVDICMENWPQLSTKVIFKECCSNLPIIFLHSLLTLKVKVV